MSEFDRVRNKEIRFKVTKEELEFAKDKANIANMNIGELMRKSLFDCKIIILSSENILEASKAINDNSYEINKIGVNINQLLKVIHENNDTYSKNQIETVLRELENLRFEYEKLCDVMMNKLYGLE